MSDIIETASSLHIRGFSGGQKEEELGKSQSDLQPSPGSDISRLAVVDPQSDHTKIENEKFPVVRPHDRSRTPKSITRKSDGRKSSAPKKLSVLEDENVVEKTGENLDATRYSILGSYLNSCKNQTLSTNTKPSDTTDMSHVSSGI